MLLLNGATVCYDEGRVSAGMFCGRERFGRGTGHIYMEKARRNTLRASCRHEIYEKADANISRVLRLNWGQPILR